MLWTTCWLMAQEQNKPIKMNVLPEGYNRAYLDGKDTVAIVNLREVYVFPKVKFRNRREEQKYWKLVRDVKRTLPYA